MSIFRRRPRPGRRQSEQLLDGVGPVPPAYDDLSGLLAAARSGDVVGSELPGERAALAAFRAAQTPSADVLSADTTPEEYTSVRTVALRRILAVKVLAAGALTMTVGGVAFAATGMPVPGVKHHPRTVAAGDTAPSASPTKSPTKDGVVDGVQTKHAGDATKGGPTRPGKMVPGLDNRARLLVQCRLWNSLDAKAKAGEHPALRKKALKRLVTAAGGADKVKAYCDELVAKLCPVVKPGAGGASPTAHPGFLPGCPRPFITKKPSSGATTHPFPDPTRTKTMTPMPMTTGSPDVTRPVHVMTDDPISAKGVGAKG